MKMSVLVSVLLLAGECFGDTPKYALKSIKADLPSGTSKELQAMLQTEAVLVSDETGTGVLKLWLVQNINSTASTDQVKNGLTYREWTEGSIVGVVQFEQAWVDYRKQSIAAGAYTLRLAYQPDTGDHKDTAPGTEFLLLCPVEADTNTDTLATNDLVKLSKKATGSDHAGVMLLLPPKGASKTAEIKSSDNTVSLQISLPMKTSGTTGTVGLQVVIWGHSAKR
jgi:hypothetical protein